MNPTRIIIEGCDGTGKSTLARLLASKYGFDICHCTGEDPKDFEFYKQTARKNHVIWDRHVIGELIYPEIFLRKPQVSTEDARIVLSYAQENYGKVLVLTSDITTIKDRLLAREPAEDRRIFENIREINDKFVSYAEVYNIPVVDTSKVILSDIFEILETPYDYKFMHK